jgi:hypothetical protein
MKILRILIVENEMSLAMDLEMMIEKIASATFVTEESVGAAKKVLHEALDFAFLDVDVTKGNIRDCRNSRTQACAFCFCFELVARPAAN